MSPVGKLLRERHRVAIGQFEAQLAEAMQLRGEGFETGDFADVGTLVSDREELEMVTAALEQQVMRLQEAVDRFDAGRFGLCDGCGKKIPKARLKFLPWATHCVPCQERKDRR
ncbi:MAG TPA: TraR/DksA C4-type zinc finger protein [Candidatus Limnocylindrales bacterium]|nr:TraR/DksA C4-type zinc finger protein [Candidatus Limnocylindrales bacterium]